MVGALVGTLVGAFSGSNRDVKAGEGLTEPSGSTLLLDPPGRLIRGCMLELGVCARTTDLRVFLLLGLPPPKRALEWSNTRMPNNAPAK